MYKFNDREITFNKYNTPTPWMNYLSNGTFHTMISQAGGGVAFYKSPQISLRVPPSSLVQYFLDIYTIILFSII